MNIPNETKLDINISKFAKSSKIEVNDMRTVEGCVSCALLGFCSCVLRNKEKNKIEKIIVQRLKNNE